MNVKKVMSWLVVLVLIISVASVMNPISAYEKNTEEPNESKDENQDKPVTVINEDGSITVIPEDIVNKTSDKEEIGRQGVLNARALVRAANSGVSLGSITWISKNNGIDIGVSYSSNYSNVQFKWMTYNVDTQQWALVSDWSTGANWATWRPDRGNYWLHVQAKIPGEEAVSLTCSYAVNRNYLNNEIVNFNIKGNAVTNYIEDQTLISGYTNGAYAADAAFLGYSDDGTKVKFMLAGVIGWVNQSEVAVVGYDEVNSLSYYMVQNGRLRHKIMTNVYNSTYANNLDLGVAPSYLSANHNYFSYDGHYFYEADTKAQFQKMLTDYKNNTRANSINENNPFYNYFQYLPLRSKSVYTENGLANTIANLTIATSKLRGTAGSFINYQNTYGVNALLMLGVAINESAYGTSSIATSKNNLFGLNAVDSSPGQSANFYPSVDSCIKDFAETYMSKQYLNSSNWKYYGGFLGDKASGINIKYASDPYWGEKAANYAWKLDELNSGKDQYAYTIGMKDTINSSHTDLNIRNQALASSLALYSTGAQSNHAFLIKGEENNFYKVQSDSNLNSNRNGLSSTGDYNFTEDYGYVSKNYIKIVSPSNNVSLQSIAWIKQDTAIDVGVSYVSGDPNVQFKWMAYNLDTKQWELVSDWYSGNWTTWRPKNGNYWLYVQAKTSSGKTDEMTICFSVDKDYSVKNIKLDGISYIVRDTGIDVGVAYTTNDSNVQFKWMAYNLDTKQWELISDWYNGNWATWKPSKGNYWLYVQAKTSDGKIQDKTISFNVNKNYVTTLDLNGMAWIVKNTGIDVGVAYASNSSSVQFKWQAYNLDTKQWQLISDWYNGNWATWKPSKGNYWLHVEAKTSDGKVASLTINFRVEKDY